MTTKKTRCEICDRDFASQDALTMHNNSKHSKKGFVFKSNNKYAILAVIVIVTIISAVMFLGHGKPVNTLKDNSLLTDNSNSAQQIVISFIGGYTPNTIRVKANQLVEITLDSSVSGCYRDFNIPNLGVSSYSQSPSQKITFTPTEKGTFVYACGMNMARGTIIVE